MDGPAPGALPCGRGLPRGVRGRGCRGELPRRDRRRRAPAGGDGPRPEGGAQTARARLQRGGAAVRRGLLAGFVVLLATAALAEEPARLAGRVTDEAGAPVAGA